MAARPVKQREAVAIRTDRRLMITSIRMENFKSYFGVQEVGPFHKNFSSVVGPNGSGKSNVIDALLFVFGKRAKQLRQGKLKDLIHKSDGHDDLEYCRVSVFFQDIIDQPNGEYEVVPGSETIVMREARKNETSTYHVDGKKMSFAEVATLLRARGIDLDHNRFLILQGEVEQIAMMKPRGQGDDDDGLLEYFEDIIGSDRFKADIEEKGKQLEQLNETWSEKLNRVKIVEKEKDSLEGGKKEAEEYLSQENQLTSKRSELFQCYRHECTANVDAATTKLAESQGKLNELQTSLKGAMDSAKEKEKIHAKELKEHARLQKAVEETKSDFSSFERKEVQHKEDLKHAKAKEKKLEKSIQTNSHAVSELASKLGNFEGDQAKHTADIQKLKTQLAKEEDVLEGIFGELKGSTAQLQTQLESKQRDLMPLSRAVCDAQSKLAVRQEALDLHCSAAKAHATRLQESRDNLAKAKETTQSCGKDVQKMETRQKQATSELAGVEKELAQLGNKEESLLETVKSARGKMEEAKMTSKQQASGNKVLEVLMKAQKDKKLSGIHGRLGDLGAIDDKFDCAITTACGALNNIVVQTVAQAQACVDYLRKTAVGRATFIIIEKLEYLKAAANAQSKSPEGVSRLYDLVKMKGGKPRHRVVTLTGQLIDTSGTMSGGGARAARGGMSAHLADEISPAQLQALEKTLEDTVASLTAHRERKAKLEAQKTALTAEIAQLAESIQRLKMDGAAATEQIESLTQLVEELSKRDVTSAADAAKQKELEGAVEKEAKLVAKAKAAAEQVEQEVKRLEEAVMAVGGVRLRSQKSKVEGLKEQIVTLQGRITTLAVEHKTAMRNHAKLAEKLEAEKADLEKTVAQIAELVEDFKDIEKGALEVKDTFNKATAMLEEKESTMKQMKEEHDKLKAEASKLQAVELDLQHAVEESERILKDNQTKEKHWAKKLQGLKFHIVGPPAEDDGKEKEQEATLPVLSAEQMQQVDKEALQYDITVLEEKLNNMKPNLAAIKEFYKKESEYLSRVADLDVVTEARDKMRTEFEDLRKQRLDTFMAGFGIITTKLKEMYQMITLGGDAELELVDRLNPFSEGIQFSVRPPKKSWKNISNLSGGEKTLSSLALVFALHHYKPTPLYVMDEIDAALDFKNVSIVANYIKERTANAQFIIISLRNNMFELADRLIGIYKTENCTKSVTIDPNAIAAKAEHTAKHDAADPSAISA